MHVGEFVEYQDERYGPAVAITMDTIEDGRVRLLTMWDSLKLEKPENLSLVDIPEEAKDLLIIAKEAQEFIFEHRNDLMDGSIPGWDKDINTQKMLLIYNSLNSANKILRSVKDDIPMDSFKIFNYILEINKYFEEEKHFYVGGRASKEDLSKMYSHYWFGAVDAPEIPKGLKIVDGRADPKDPRTLELIKRYSPHFEECILPRTEFVSYNEGRYTIFCIYTLFIENPTFDRVKKILNSIIKGKEWVV